MVFSYGSPRKLKQPWFTQAILDAGVYVRVPKSQKREKEDGREKQGWLKKKKKSTESNTILKILKDEPLRKELYKISRIFLLIIK